MTEWCLHFREDPLVVLRGNSNMRINSKFPYPKTRKKLGCVHLFLLCCFSLSQNRWIG